MKTITIPHILPENGFKIPVRATFIGFRNVPLIAIATNSLNHSLILFENCVEYKVCRTRRYNYSKIDSVGIFRTIGTENIEINFHNSLFSFSGNLFEKENLLELLQFFKLKEISLTDKAVDFVESNKKFTNP